MFAGITTLFSVILGIMEFLNKKNKEKVCSICVSVSLTWFVLLVLFWKGIFSDKVIIGILIGQSSLGIFYRLEKKVKERVKVFRLPFLLTLILIAYSLIEGFAYGLNVLIFLGVLWILFIVIYVYGSDSKTGGLVRKLVECCKKW